MSTREKVLVFGGGAFGTALAQAFSVDGREVLIHARDPKLCAEINGRHENTKYCASHKLNSSIRATTEWSELFLDFPVWVYACPSSNLRNFLAEISTRFSPTEKSPYLVNTAKGFDLRDNKLHHEVVEEILGEKFLFSRFLCLSGPSFAAEILRGTTTCLSLAGFSLESARHVQTQLTSPHFRVYHNNDLIGCQVGGAMKNIMAIAAGVIAGMGIGQNTQAAFINLGLGEMARLGTALGARAETFLGFSGVGDLILTCTSDLSRNRSFGTLLGQGMSVEQAKAKVGATIEGFSASKAVQLLIKKFGVRAPICEHVFEILHNGKKIHEAFDALLARPPGGEWI